MNEKNFVYLKDNLKYMGFGDTLNQDLEVQLKRGAPEFQLQLTAKINKRTFDATLNFRKSAQSDHYFFNSYHASLQRRDGTAKDQVFYLNGGKGITAREAYNLLQGRAVYKEMTTKEGQPYKAWLQLDFDKKDKHNNHEVRHYHENYGFDLKGVLARYAISELKDAEQAKALVQSLQKGNVQAVTLEKAGSMAKVFVEANPQYKNVTFYDVQLRRIQAEQLSPYGTLQSLTGPDLKQGQTAQTQNVEPPKNQEKGNKQEQPGSTAKKEGGLADEGETKTRRTKSTKNLLPQREGVDPKKESRHR